MGSAETQGELWGRNPQAWAAGSVFHLLQAILGLQADAPNGRLYVDPVLPSWLPDVTLRGLRIGDVKVTLRFWRVGEETRWEAASVDGRIEIEQRPWRPWTAKDLFSPADELRHARRLSGSTLSNQ